MNVVTKNTVAMLLGAAGIFALLVAIGLGSAPAIAISAVCILLTYVLFAYGDFILPLVFGAAGARQEIGQYLLVPQMDALVKKSGAGYIASVFLGVAITDSLQEKTAEQSVQYGANF